MDLCTATRRVETVVPRQETGPWLARHFAAAALCPEHAADLGLEVSLATSEMVKETLRRSGPPVILSVDCWGSSVVLTVTERADDRLTVPEQLTALLLERLTQGWGVQLEEDRRVFWCLLPTSVGHRPAAPVAPLAAMAPLRHSA